MKLESVQLIITFAGLIFFSTSLAIILIGKKVGDTDAGPQKIKVGKFVEVSTNSVLMLLIISACIALAPISLAYWKPELSDYVKKDEAYKAFIPLEIHGVVFDNNGNPANNIDIEIFRYLDNSVHKVIKKTVPRPVFSIRLKEPRPYEEYKITWYKKGFAKAQRDFAFNVIPFEITLKTEEEEN